MWAGFGIILGVIIALHLPIGLLAHVSWLLTAVALFVAGFSHRRVSSVPIIVVAGIILGVWRGGGVQLDSLPLTSVIGQTVELRGRVIDDVSTGKRGELVLRLNAIELRGETVSGEAWVSTKDTGGSIKRGDYVTVNAKVAEGFGAFSASMFQANVLNVTRIDGSDPAGRVRDNFAEKIKRVINEPSASLGIGYLVGQRRTLPDELATSLQVAGLTHVVVASGYNLTILVRLCRRLFLKISRFSALFSSAALVTGFIAVTGISPSMSRAGLVTGLSLLAWYYGRKFHPVVLLSIAASVTLLIKPSYGWNDLGWQLSFAAFAGVMIVAPVMQRYFFGDTPPSTVRQILGETISAQLVTLPIIAASFGVISNVALVANLLVLPFVPLAMLLTFIAGISSITLPLFAASMVAYPANILLNYMVFIAEWLGTLSFAQTEYTPPFLIIAAFYILLLGSVIYMVKKTGYKLRESNIIK